MRNILLLFFCIQIWFVSLGQSPVYFNKILSSIPGTSTISTVVKADSGYFLVVDNILPGQTIALTQFLMINTIGVIMDSMSFPDNKYRYTNVFPGNTALRTNSGKYLVATSRIDTLNAGYAVLVCLDTNLDTLWTRTFTHPDTLAAAQLGAYVYNVHTAIRQTWDGGFIIAGNYSKDCIQGNTRSYLLKTDSMGVMQWIKKYDNVGKVYDLVLTPDSGYAFTDFAGGFHLNITDQNGEIIVREKPNNETHLVSGSIGVCSNGDFVVMAPYVYSNPMPNLYLYGINTIRYSQNGTIIWDKKFLPFHSFKCHSLHQAFTLQILPDNEIVIGGTSTVYNPLSSPASEYKGVMMKLTQNGDSVWARYYSYGAFTDVGQFERMILTDDGGFLAVGYYYPFPPPAGTGSRPWMVKMDSLGCDTPGCHLIGIEERVLSIQELEVFPNPFSEIMHVVLPEEYSGGKLVMYDVQGKKAMETEMQANWGQQNFALETTHINPGIYLIELTDRDGKVWKRKAVRR